MTENEFHYFSIMFVCKVAVFLRRDIFTSVCAAHVSMHERVCADATFFLESLLLGESRDFLESNKKKMYLTALRKKA